MQACIYRALAPQSELHMAVPIKLLEIRIIVLAFTILVASVFASFCHWHVVLRRQATEVAQNNQRNEQYVRQLDIAVAQQVDLTLQHIDSALLYLRRVYISNPKNFVDAARDVQHSYPEGMVKYVTVFDADGYLSYASNGERSRIYFGDREHFLVHANTKEDRLFISRPITGRLANIALIQLTRPIYDDRGKFVGVIGIPLRPEFLAAQFGKLHLNPLDLVAVVHDRGSFVTRSRGLAEALALTVSKQQPYLGKQGGDYGLYKAHSLIEDQALLFAWRHLDGWPVSVLVGMSDAEGLAQLAAKHSHERKTAAFFIGALLTFGLGSFTMLLMIRNRNMRLRILQRESQHRFQMIFENTAEAIVFAGQSGFIELANRQALTLFGYSEEEIVKLRHADLMAQEESRLAEESTDGAITSGEVMCKRKNGTTFHAEVTVTDFNDAAGLACATAIIRDVSELRRKNLAIRRNQELIATVFNSIDETIIVTDSEGYVVAVNAAWYLFVRSGSDVLPEDPIGQECRELISGLLVDVNDSKREEILAGLEGVISGRADRYLLEYENDGERWGATQWMYLRVIRRQSVSGGVIMLLEEITDQKRIDRERLENSQRVALLSRHMFSLQEEARRRLAAELHDRTSPTLAAVGINLDIASIALKDGATQEAVERLMDNKQLLKEISYSLRDVCNELRPAVLDYAGLADAVESYANQFSKRTGLAVSVNVQENFPRMVADVETGLFRIVQEALTNVAKHASASTVNVELSCNESEVRVKLVDDGVGFRMEESSIDGHGLINMRELAEFIGGYAHIVSDIGEGTAVEIVVRDYDD